MCAVTVMEAYSIVSVATEGLRLPDGQATRRYGGRLVPACVAAHSLSRCRLAAADVDIEALGLLDGLEGRARAERAELIAWLLTTTSTLTRSANRSRRCCCPRIG
jgi:hypothetical protein